MLRIIATQLLLFFPLFATDVSFNPPSGWHFADRSQLGGNVQMMVVGKGVQTFPPSMNLTRECFEGTLSDYVQIIKRINKTKRNPFDDLGTINTQAGTARLIQSFSKQSFGQVQMLHAILLHEGTIYLLTASALKTEFPHHYKEFFTALRSLKIG